jgi:CDP-diacylglycerol--glycerol-3-phosphate 3-phosphatidyltransferase/cardiolipin synthase
MLTIPNILTLLRIILIPFFVGSFYLPFEWSNQLCAFLFALAAITDWLDGYLARKWQQTSPLGAFLDPVADKLMVAAALIVLVQAQPTLFMVIPAVVIIGREITISALREWMAELGERATVAVSVIGKFKTAAQMLALVLLIYRDDIGLFPTFTVGYVLLYVAVILTLWSMLVYLQAAWPALSRNSSD